jgi:hypothetical protein
MKERKPPNKGNGNGKGKKQAQSAQYTTIITFKEIVFIVFIHWFR